MSKFQDADDFWLQVDIKGDDECWPWLGNDTFKDGRGIAYSELSGRNTSAPKVVWEYIFGPVPKGKLVCHDCDHPWCCNPYHLWLGTYKENIQDAIQKGRIGNEEQRKIISEANKGRHHTEKAKIRMSLVRKGVSKSEEHRRKIGEANKRRVWTEESRRKASESHKGKHHSEESKRQMSEYRKGRPVWITGKHHSEETKQKMSIAQRRRFALEWAEEDASEG